MSLLERASECLGSTAIELLPSGERSESKNPTLTFGSNSKPTQITCRAHAYARTVFGLAAKRRIMRAAGALDRFDSEIGNYLFLTATLPGDTDEAKWAVANYSEILINRLKAWFSKRLKERKEFYVWEHQKRGALHFHYCIHVPVEGIKQSIEKGFKRQWARLLDSVGKEFGVNFWGKWACKPLRYRVAILQARVERVYKSVGAYMAGYLAGKGDKHEHDKKHHWFPKRWFGVSRPLSKLVQEHTEKQVEEFGTCREAQEYWSKKEEELIDESLTDTKYCHKVGEGKTHVFYHTQEKQQQLWQSKKMLTHSNREHPRIATLIQSVLLATQCGHQLTMVYPRYSREHFPKSFGYFEDATYSISLKRGALSQTQTRMMIGAYSELSSFTTSEFQLKKLQSLLRRANLLISGHHHQMQWNQYGWLINERDFDEMIDYSIESCQARTSDEDRSASGGEIESSGHVPRDSEPLPEQLTIL